MKIFRVGAACVVTALTLSGCALGIHKGDDSPSVSYVVPRDYKTVFLRAQNQANECLRGDDKQYVVHARVDPVTSKGEIDVIGPMGNVLVARTKLQATDAKHTYVSQTVWGVKPWDINALNAMRESIRLDTSVCFAYR